MFSVVIIAYTSYVMAGGDASKFYLPYFETNLADSRFFNIFDKCLCSLIMTPCLCRSATQSAGSFVIFFCLAFIACSGLLVQGVRKGYRGFFFPWMICMILIVLFMAVFGLWIIIGYYIVSIYKSTTR